MCRAHHTVAANSPRLIPTCFAAFSCRRCFRVSLCFIQQQICFLNPVLWLIKFIYHHLTSLRLYHWNVPGRRVWERAAMIRPMIGYGRGLYSTHTICPTPLYAWPDLMTHFPPALPKWFLPGLPGRANEKEAGTRWKKTSIEVRRLNYHDVTKLILINHTLYAGSELPHAFKAGSLVIPPSPWFPEDIIHRLQIWRNNHNDHFKRRSYFYI